MKKEVVLFISLIMIVSLAGIAYSAALTNPGHGVEEIGNGTSPIGAREWNANFTQWTDFYIGPSSASVNKWNIPWFGFTNTDTRAAQNNLGDWCVDQVDPWGIYMTCFNNATNMTLIQSYSWNGTNFTKNDTIKNGSNVIEQEILMGGPNGAQAEQTLFEPASGDSASTTIETLGGVSTIETSIQNNVGTAFTQIWQGLAAGGTDGNTDIFVKGDDSSADITSEDDAGTTKGEIITTPDSIIGTAENPAGDVGKFQTGNDLVDLSVTDAVLGEVSNMELAKDGANAGTWVMSATDTVEIVSADGDATNDELTFNTGSMVHSGDSGVDQYMLSYIAQQTDLEPNFANPISANTDIVIVTNRQLGIPGAAPCIISSIVVDTVLDKFTYTCDEPLGGACVNPCLVSIDEIEIINNV